MTTNAVAQVSLYFAIGLALAVPLGRYLALVLDDGPVRGPIGRFLGPVERLVYRGIGVDPTEEMGWGLYARCLIGFSVVGVFVVYLLQRFQGWLPGNPDHLPAVPPLLALNTAVSFVTNTNWQAYSGETTLSYLTQAIGLGVQNFGSAAAGIAVLVALIRGFRRAERPTIGNVWVDLTRAVIYILVPLSAVLALFLVSQGVVQTWRPAATVTTLEAGSPATIALGPAAGQVAIKQLGTNGGGFFNANSAHPLENPTPLSNLAESIAILLIPGALCFAFGRLLGDRRHGWVYWAAMAVILVPLTFATTAMEQRGTPLLAAAGADLAATSTAPGGNMEGKEVRFGIAASAIWATATTAASNGSVNAAHDSLTPLGGLFPLWLMQLGEVVFGGVGSGLYGMLCFALVAVFVAGLMVGRTPEYLGKKIEAFEMKMVALVILVPAATVLLGTAVALMTAEGRAGILNPGPHGFSEVLYAFSSAGNNNGSAFGGLNANSAFYNIILSLAMWLGRFFVAIPVLAIASALAAKKTIPVGEGTLPTTGPLFVGLLIGSVVLVGALTFLPALALGPIVEHLTMAAR